MEIAVSNKVIARNGFGQFISECEIAGAQTMQEVAEHGAELSRQFAPIGKKPDPRTPKLRSSITAAYTATTAHWKATARHAVIVESAGSTQHFQTGYASFFWERESRMWTPGKNMIDHPPTQPQPYLRPAYEIIMRGWMKFAKLHYPQ